MIRQAYLGSVPRFTSLSLAVLSAFGLLACASPSTTNNNTGGTTGSGTGGAKATGGTTGTGGSHTGGTTGTGGSVSTGGSTGTGGAHTGGSTGSGGSVSTGGSTGTGGSVSTGGSTGTGGSVSTGGSTGTGGSVSTGGSTGTGGSAGGSGSCANTNANAINEDASGYICGNTWGIQGAWYCYSDGSDSTISCKGSNGKGMGAIPWTSTSSAMCLSGTMGTGTGSYAGIGFKVNSGPPGSTATPGTWDASKIVGFAITLTSGASGTGSGGMILNLEYPTSTDLAPVTLDAPGITVPGVPSTGSITYNALFSDAVLANNKLHSLSVDPTKLTDVKIAFFPDSISHSYDFCIKSVVPIMSAPNPVVATGTYGPTWSNQLPQAVNGINGYAVQSAPFPMAGNPMTMQVSATSDGVGFTYTAGGGFQTPNSGPGSFPAIISGWGPGHDGIQFYGPYQGGKKISQLTSVKSNWTFTMGSSGDAVYDVWFANSAKPQQVGVELMIWMGNKDKMPIGYDKNAAGPAVNGRTPYTGTNGTTEQVVSYWVPIGTTGNASNFDLLPYFQDAAGKYAGLTSDWYLLGIQTGFEVYSGTWTTTDYNINIQ